MKFLIPTLLLAATFCGSCNKHKKSLDDKDRLNAQAMQKIVDEFPNRKLGIWTKDESYELHLYGSLAYIRRSDSNANRLLYPISSVRCEAIWNAFHELPGIGDYKNEEPYVTRSRDTHHIIFLNESAGVFLGTDRISYSIPRTISGDAYVSWLKSVRDVIIEYQSEQGASSDR
ncbi:MAG: hypothetical protein H7A51_13365 [Akkermansiaceae bacterium]|nr:hypothetical protein [Akkermansiaceae bacterium]